MEPMNCTVALHRDRCELWLGTQAATRVQSAAAKITGLPLEAVEVHNQFLGGGFGRRVEADVVEQAVRIAQKVDRPVKVIWSREEDVQHDFYKPQNGHIKPFNGRLRKNGSAAGIDLSIWYLDPE